MGLSLVVREPAPTVAAAAGWALTLYPEAAEAGGSFRYVGRPTVRVAGSGDPERSRSEAARRARGKVRRYAAANGLSRLWTLTYAGAGVHDPDVLRADVAVFFRRLRTALGGEPLPYAWVPEWHPGGHGLHAHFGAGRFMRKGLVADAWGHGFVHAKLLSDLPVGSTGLGEARRVGRYLGKYVTKTFDSDAFGRHRYEVAQGFQPASVTLRGRTAQDALDAASERMRSQPGFVWSSERQPGWQGPPAVWASWG